MKRTYLEKLRDPRWQKKRLEIFQRDEWRCFNCGNNSDTLNVHHTRYRKGLEPWEYEMAELVTLCETCHKKIGKKVEDLLLVVGFLKGKQIDHVTDVAIHIAQQNNWTSVLFSLEIQGATRQLASHCVFLRRKNNVIELELNPLASICRTPAAEEKLTQALSRYYGEPIRLEIRTRS